MRAKVIQIGNSQGVRIPKGMLAKCKLKDGAEVDLEVENGAIVVRPLRAPRSGWEESLKEMMRSEHAVTVDDAVRNRFDEEDWQW